MLVEMIAFFLALSIFGRLVIQDKVKQVSEGIFEVVL